MGKRKTFFYKNFTDDVVESKNQEYKIKNNYKWIHKSIFYKIYSNVLFSIFYVSLKFYYKFINRIKFENMDILKKYKKQGYFLYGNHTQPVGDAFKLIMLDRRFYVVISQANLGIPILGKMLPALGGLPIPDSTSGMKKFIKSVNTRIKQNKVVVIYPEAHVWPYYTKIRPFDETSFKFPVQNNAPSFCMTTTYYKRKNRKKPGIKIYIDGPFLPDDKLDAKANEEKLCNEIHDTMVKRSKNSNYEYYTYKEEKP